MEQRRNRLPQHAGVEPQKRWCMDMATDFCMSHFFSFSYVADAAQAFSARVQQISQQVFKINSNVSSIQRLVALLGTHKDTEELRTKL